MEAALVEELAELQIEVGALGGDHEIAQPAGHDSGAGQVQESLVWRLAWSTAPRSSAIRIASFALFISARYFSSENHT